VTSTKQDHEEVICTLCYANADRAATKTVIILRVLLHHETILLYSQPQKSLDLSQADHKIIPRHAECYPIPTRCRIMVRAPWGDVHPSIEEFLEHPFFRDDISEPQLSAQVDPYEMTSIRLRHAHASVSEPSSYKRMSFFKSGSVGGDEVLKSVFVG